MALKKNPLSKKEAGKIEHTHKLHYFGRKMLDSDFHSNLEIGITIILGEYEINFSDVNQLMLFLLIFWLIIIIIINVNIYIQTKS